MSSLGASYAYIHELRKRCKEMERKKTDGGVATEEKSSKGRVHPSDTPSPVCREERGEESGWSKQVLLWMSSLAWIDDLQAEAFL
ncbi:unnamed protein product [Musa acuminata var. zebrina]